MKLRMLLVSALAALVLAMGIGTAQAETREVAATAVSVPVTGTFTDAVGGTGTFDGTATVTRFVNQGGTLVAHGTVTGTLTDSLGNLLGTVTTNFTTQVVGANATCEILHLELGPIDLDLLGLVVHVDRIVIDITAEQGPGNLLGNLLCAIAGLLDGGGPLGGLAGLLNRILRLLG